MHPQLQAVIDDFESARARLHRLAEQVPAERWTQRPAPESWSVAECVAHLNLTSRAFMPGLRDALERAQPGAVPARLRRDLVGWLLWRNLQPGKGMKIKTSAAFIPESTAPVEDLVADFDRLQDEQIELVRRAEGLPLGRIKVASPFSAAVKYNAYAALTVLPTHQHRHLLQAERAWETISGTA